MRCKKIEIFFTDKQQDIVDPWFTLYKHVYNQAVKYVRINKIENFINLRKHVKESFTLDFKEKLKLSKIPVHTIDNAIKDVVNAYHTAYEYAKITKRHFRIRYKKKNANDTIVLEKSVFPYKRNSIALKTLGLVNSSESIIGIQHDCILQKQKDKYILFVPTNTPFKVIKDKKKLISLDPGIRTFQTGYILNHDKTVEYAEYGDNFTKEISPFF